ncbi:histone H1-I-like [Ochlerotatus camptorhynchus]|uniref:histone H1-I-like n=1 Tax=Ochlerotatus camptorhynchus TaxID=644619 RepID=UPI0031DEF4E1
MADVEEKQTEAVNEEQPEKKPRKSRKKSAKDEGGEKPKKPRPRNTDNPPVHDMIIEALDVLDERKGVTLYAIKRYLEDNYHVDMTKVAVHVRKVLKNGVDNGDIIRTRGVGAMGRFKVKHTKPTMLKKRCAPEDYQQLPYINKHRVAKPRKVTTPAKPKVTALAKKEDVPKAKTTPKGKRGRPGRKTK